MLTRDLFAVANFLLLKRCSVRSAAFLLLAHKINLINSPHLSAFCLTPLLSFVPVSFTGVRLNWICINNCFAFVFHNTLFLLLSKLLCSRTNKDLSAE